MTRRRWRGWIAAALGGWLLFGCQAGPGPEPVRPSPPASVAASVARPTPSPGRADDLAFLAAELARIHPGPADDRFEADIADLSARADELTPEAFMVATMGLLAPRDRDGHTGVIPFAQDGLVEAWPIALYGFEEGLVVVDAQPPHEDLIGGRLVAVAGHPVDEVIEAVVPLVAADNPWTVRARLPAYLAVPQVLDGLALLSDGDGALTVELADGSPVDVRPTRIPIDEFRTWRGLFDPLVPPPLPPADAPISRQNRDRHFWSVVVDRTVYVGYNQVQASDPTILSMTQFSRDLAAEIEGGTADRIVVDIRSNPGGNNGTYGPLLDVLIEQATARPGSVVVLIGRSTFSAAANFATELRAVDGVTFIGEPTGGAPNLFGDATIVTLPASGLRVHIATREWTFAPGSDALAIEPDVQVPVRWSDVAEGRDAALEIALDRR